MANRKDERDTGPPERPAKDTLVSKFAVDLGDEETDQIDLAALAQEMLVFEGEDKLPVFVVMSGLDVGSVIRLDQGPVVLGRDPTCTTVLQDEGVSRQHVKASLLPNGRVAVEDMGSTNGTVLHGQRIGRASLAVGDKLLLGWRTILKLAFLDKMDHAFQQEIYDSSTRDALTGLYNRTYLMKRLATDLSFATRHGLPLSFIILDLDNFKNVNDTHGHQCGDRLLARVAAAISSAVRFEDVVGRYGGEEFALVAGGVDEVGARALGEKLRALIALAEVPVSPDGISVSVTVSVGSVTVPGGVRIDSAAAVEAADSNLYAAKFRGRNCVISSTLEGGTDAGR